MKKIPLRENCFRGDTAAAREFGPVPRLMASKRKSTVSDHRVSGDLPPRGTRRTEESTYAGARSTEGRFPPAVLTTPLTPACYDRLRPKATRAKHDEDMWRRHEVGPGIRFKNKNEAANVAGALFDFSHRTAHAQHCAKYYKHGGHVTEARLGKWKRAWLGDDPIFFKMMLDKLKREFRRKPTTKNERPRWVMHEFMVWLNNEEEGCGHQLANAVEGRRHSRAERGA